MANEIQQIDRTVPNEDQGSVILGATLTVTIVALITMVTRLYVRIRMIRNVGWDDFVMMSAMVLCIVGQIIIVPEVGFGAGRHKQYIDPSDFANGYKLNFITQPIYLFAICLVKISVGFFLLRVAAAAMYRRIIIVIMTFMGLYTIGCFFTIVLQCTNLAVQWDPTVVGTCWSAHTIKTLSSVNVSVNIITDMLFSIVIPIPLLWSLQMNKRQKSSLMCILGLGIFATAAAIVKASFLPSYGKTGDWLWDSRNLTIWTVIESNVGIIAGNLPCLKPLFRVVLGSTYGRGSHKTPAPAYSYQSRSYGSVTPRKSVIAKGWGTLTSHRTANEENDIPNSYGGTEICSLTTINAKKDSMIKHGGSSASGEERGNTGESSVHSLPKVNASRELDGIKIDTKFNVSKDHSWLDFGFEEANRKEKREMI